VSDALGLRASVGRVAANGSRFPHSMRFAKLELERITRPSTPGALTATFRRDTAARCGGFADESASSPTTEA